MQNILSSETVDTAQTPSWQVALQRAFRDLPSLCAFLELDITETNDLRQVAGDFPLMVPQEYAARISKRTPRDPLLLQVLPQAREALPTPGFTTDPLQENQQNPLPGLLHKYHGRVLVTLTGRCAIHCRYCFRRHFPYHENNPGRDGHAQIIDYIQADPTISEVILSGGDPLIANDKTIAAFMHALEMIHHVTTLRIHTRLPVVIPQRVTDEFITILQHSRLQSVIVHHINHPNEIDTDVARQCRRLRDAGIINLNQSVLLRHVNDNADTLIQLSKKLFRIGVLPYYLHLCDKVQGCAHFDVSEQTAQQIMQQLLASLPGYLVPKCVREVPGEKSKIAM